MESAQLPPWEFYQQYLGHSLEHLEKVLSALRSQTKRAEGTVPVVFLAGDSSLDNKHWLFQGSKADPRSYFDERWSGNAIGAYKELLDPPRMIKDLAYWLTTQGMAANGEPFAALNTAVEESTIEGRAAQLKAQDLFIRDNITSGDILVISVGGNDVALTPTAETQAAVAQLLRDQQEEAMEHFEWLFRDQMQAYASALVAKAKPRAVIVCMLYHLDESAEGGGFADSILRALGYNENPGFLQGIIRAVYEHAIAQISLEGTEVVPFPLFNVLDGKDTHDYVARVEPSVAGGEKMGRALAQQVREILRRRSPAGERRLCALV